MSGDILACALADLRDDIDRATAELARSIGDACGHGSSCLTDDVRDIARWENALHEIRDAIEDSTVEFRFKVERARRLFKDALSPLVKGGDDGEA